MIPIKRLTGDDGKHLWWLFKTGVKQLCKGNLREAREAYYWIRIHLSYRSKLIKGEDKSE